VRFTATSLPGVWHVAAEPRADERGDFTRLHCEGEFAQQRVPAHVVQTSYSRTRQRGTVRGLHFQWPPSQEAKLVRCTAGRIYDVVVDLRPESPAYGRHVALELDAAALDGLLIPPGCAHGFQSLVDDVAVLYQMTDVYVPELAAGVRWDDPAFAIAWPLPASAVHPRDALFADFEPAGFRALLARHGSWEAA
jgi:dTDP-4-dehydrorhamnose 3,5-epimerase